MLDYQKFKLQILWAAYSKRLLNSGDHSTIQKLKDSEAFQQLKTSLPEKWNELQLLMSALHSDRG
jgi:hypothetical protein